MLIKFKNSSPRIAKRKVLYSNNDIMLAFYNAAKTRKNKQNEKQTNQSWNTKINSL